VDEPTVDQNDPARPGPWVLPALLAFALLVRAFAWGRALMMMNDGPDFLWQAQRFLDGDWAAALSHPYHPLYGGLAALGVVGGLGLEDAAITVSFLGGVLVVLAAWGMARLAFPEEPKAPVAAALVAAVAGRFVEFSSDIQSDGLFAGLAAVAFWAIFSAARAGGCKRRLLLAGVLTGLTYLARPEGLFVGCALGVWVLGSTAPFTRRLAGLGVYAAGTLLLVAPYVVALHDVTGAWGLSLKPSLQFAGLRDAPVTHLAPADSPMGWPYVPARITNRKLRQQAAEAEAEAESSPPAVQAKESEPRQGSLSPFSSPLFNLLGMQSTEAGNRGTWSRAVSESLKGYVAALRVELLLLIVPGLMALFRAHRRLALALIAIQLGWFAVTCWHLRTNDYITNRHFLIAHTVMLPVAGRGLLAFWQRGAALRVVAVLILIVATISGTQPRRDDNGPRLEALAWVREHTSPEQAFATHRRRDGFYAERVAITTRMPVDDKVFARRIALEDTPYLVYDEEYLERYQPDWVPQGLVHEVQRFEAEGGDTVLVLEPRFP